MIMMKKTYFYWMILSLFVTVDCFAGTASVAGEETLTIKDAVECFEQGAKASRYDISVVNLRGSWYEMGRQYGVAMREPIEKVLSRIVDPDVVAISNVLWNTEYNKLLVRELNIEADTAATGFVTALVSSLHNAWAAARNHGMAVLGEHETEFFGELAPFAVFV